MTRSMFGWSLPPGVSRLPGDEPEPPMPGDPGWPRCACGSFLRMATEQIAGAPEYARCQRHGYDYKRCEELATVLDNGDMDDVPQALWEESRGCSGVWVAAYLYRTCRRCGAVNREEVM